MLDALIEFVQKAQGEDFEKLCMEDAALCIAWCRSWDGNAARKAQYESVPKIVETWIKTPQADVAHTEGRRHQWILRELVDELQAGRARSLAWDQVALLTSVLNLIEMSGTGDRYARLRTLLTPHAKLLAVQAKSLPAAPGLPTISARLHVVSSKQVLASRPREVKLFAGIPVNVRGPVLVHERGHLKILDQVPENCTVVVENGSVSVGGFVLGRVAASQHCEVRENISGMVVVRQGNVRARGIMVRSKVISKWGSVCGKQAESPDLVFAGTEIRIENTTNMGQFKAPEITVLGDVCGGVYHVTKQLTADRFRSAENRNLSIVLRQDLTCQDYGENPGPDGLKLLMRANRMKREITTMRERVSLTQSEAEHAARCALAFLLGEDSADPVAERLQKAQHRLALINRVTSIFQTLIGVAEERVEQLARFEGKIADLESDEDTEKNLNEVHADFANLVTEGGVENDLNDEMQDIVGIRERLLSPNADLAKVAQTLEHMRERIRVWKREREVLHDFITEHESGVKILQGANERVRTMQTAMPMVQFLKQIITHLRERGDAPNSPQMLRLQSGFMRVVLRTINLRVERAETEKRAIEKARESLHEVAERLRKEFQISFEGDEFSATEMPKVTGAFDAGVRILGDPYLLDSSTNVKGSALLTPLSVEPKTYARDAGRIVELR
ncbi:MAG: hypothetical protein IT367_19720 [Candidatus Hydrogenedentes bacterium]|nr:hypothetical protein [Candidatus Hydrogenedentota bacterium]